MQSIEVSTYGWPFCWFIEKLRNRVRLSQLNKQGIDVSTIALGDQSYTDESGVQRDVENRLFPFYGSWPGRRLLSLAACVQRLFITSDWGISFMVKATKPDD